MSIVPDADVARFAAVFRGRTDAYGGSEGVSIKTALTLDVYRAHIEGKRPIGVYPLLDDGTCWWLGIDFDRAAKGRSPVEVDQLALHDARLTMEALGNLGINCGVYLERSKGKGAHVWVFFDRPVCAADVRRVAAAAYSSVSAERIEYFPKQDTLGGELRYGNYLNLPYHGSIASGRRVMLDPATLTPIALRDFLDRFVPFPADALAVVLEDVPAPRVRYTAENPRQGVTYPCTKPMLSHGLEEHEGRNEFGFLLSKRLHVAGADDPGALHAWNLFNRPPLEERELVKVWQQGAKYTSMDCQNALVQPFCDTSCPIHPSRTTTEYTRLRKILTEPPVYYVQVNGHDVRTTMARLFKHEALRVDVAEQSNVVVPGSKRQDWEQTLSRLLASVEEVEVPPDATLAGQAWEFVLDFLGRRSGDIEDFDLHKPVELDGWVYFRSKDLRRYLTNLRAPDLKPSDLWQLIRQNGGANALRRFGQHVLRVWSLPLSACPEPSYEDAAGVEEAL